MRRRPPRGLSLPYAILPPIVVPPPARSHGGWRAPFSPPRGGEALSPPSPLFCLLTLGRLRPDSRPLALIPSPASWTGTVSSSVLLPRWLSLTAPISLVARAGPHSPGSADHRSSPRGSLEKARRPRDARRRPVRFVHHRLVLRFRYAPCSSTLPQLAALHALPPRLVLHGASAPRPPCPRLSSSPSLGPLGASLLLGSLIPFPSVESAPSRREVAVLARDGAAGLLLSSSSSEGLARTPFGWLLTSGLAGATTKRTPSCIILLVPFASSFRFDFHCHPCPRSDSRLPSLF